MIKYELPPFLVRDSKLSCFDFNQSYKIYVCLCSVSKTVFPPVDADSNVDTDTVEFPVQEILEESVDKKKKKPKQKVGFRDRKVFIIIIIVIEF